MLCFNASNNIKNIQLIYIYYVLFGLLLLDPLTVLAQKQLDTEQLFHSAQTQEVQLIEKYSLLEQPVWQQKCTELIAELNLTQFEQCLLINAKFANAYSLAHGHVILTKGLLQNIRNDDQLAHVLAHEHAHLKLKHHQQVQQLLNKPPVFFTKSRIKKFYRQIEKQADIEADELLLQVNRDPLQVQHYLLRIKSHGDEQSSDHQKLKHRIKKTDLPVELVEDFWQ